MVLGQNLKDLRKNKRLTQKELAKLAGLSEISIRKYERGERTPKDEALTKLSKALNVSKVELITGITNKDLEDYLMREMAQYYAILKNDSSFVEIMEMYCALSDEGKKEARVSIENIFEQNQTAKYSMPVRASKVTSEQDGLCIEVTETADNLKKIFKKIEESEKKDVTITIILSKATDSNKEE